MQTHKRFGKRWTVNELLQLQREFELLQLPINDIALRHQRTPNAIMFKLDQEGFADYNFLYSQNQLVSVPIKTSSKVTSNYDYEEPIVDDDESSNYDEVDCMADTGSNDTLDYDDLKHHVLRLEKQMHALTKIIMKQTNTSSKSSSSLFNY